eukprot:10705605-Prorocentrum_lima.AAC.1
MERRKNEVDRFLLVEHRLMQVIQDTENKIALEQPRYVEVVADLEANEDLQEATMLLQDTREE